MLTIDNEVWKPCLDLAGYEVSSLGRVRSTDRFVKSRYGLTRFSPGKVLKLAQIQKGYLTFRTTGKGHLVSREVLKAFSGQRGDGLHCCHNDGNNQNNRVENLRWDSPIGNEKDKLVHGTNQRGQKHSQAKLSNEQVLHIKLRTLTSKAYAELYGVTPNHVRSIWCGCFRKYG